MEYRGTFEDFKNIMRKAGVKITKASTYKRDTGDLVYNINTSEGEMISLYQDTGQIFFLCKDVTKQKIKEAFAKHIEEKSQTSSPQTSSNVLKSSSPKIFIVHGHDHVALKDLELILRKLKLEPYILQNTSGNGLTIIEALEKEICTPTRSTKFGIVLLTPDDIGYAKSEGETTAKPRARQNVILEMGMLISALSRKNVAILRKQDVEIPSDITGILYIPFKNEVSETVKKLIQRLIESGFTLDSKAILDALN
ncbi:TIR domain-containing protein [Bartonella heixiaziensis]|uniref:TIR domain-containing protein n=1 Tax=Bartonella heixiaziensis TaxID=1461000 RepID=UPI003908A043